MEKGGESGINSLSAMQNYSRRFDFFLYFSEKISLEISCELSAKKIIQMK